MEDKKSGERPREAETPGEITSDRCFDRRRLLGGPVSLPPSSLARK